MIPCQLSKIEKCLTNRELVGIGRKRNAREQIEWVGHKSTNVNEISCIYKYAVASPKH